MAGVREKMGLRFDRGVVHARPVCGHCLVLLVPVGGCGVVCPDITRHHVIGNDGLLHKSSPFDPCQP